MPERGSSRLSAARDDARKHEVMAQLHMERPSRDAEWRDAEPPADDDPPVAAGPGDRERDDEEFRSELARHLGRSVYPARRETLLRALRLEQAPEALLDAVRRLPREGRYANVQQVVTAMGRAPAL